jgi:hypothetical protein
MAAEAAAAGADAAAAGAAAAAADDDAPQVTLASVRAALRSAADAPREKEGQLAEFIAREDFDGADELQADIDALNEQKGKLLAQAAALGVSDEAALLADD